jgi:hypothetical protein
LTCGESLIRSSSFVLFTCFCYYYHRNGRTCCQSLMLGLKWSKRHSDLD